MNKDIIAQNAACNAIVGLVDAGTANPAGRLLIYNDSSTVLAWLPFGNPAFQDSTDGTSVSNPLTDSTALADGTASWFGVFDRDSTRIWRGSVVQTGHVGDMRLAQTILHTDMTVSITQATYVVPS